jgi:hypothetical protein
MSKKIDRRVYTIDFNGKYKIVILRNTWTIKEVYLLFGKVAIIQLAFIQGCGDKFFCQEIKRLTLEL